MMFVLKVVVGTALAFVTLKGLAALEMWVSLHAMNVTF